MQTPPPLYRSLRAKRRCRRTSNSFYVSPLVKHASALPLVVHFIPDNRTRRPSSSNYLTREIQHSALNKVYASILRLVTGKAHTRMDPLIFVLTALIFMPNERLLPS